MHTACKASLAPTCGLTKQQLRLIYDYIVQGDACKSLCLLTSLLVPTIFILAIPNTSPYANDGRGMSNSISFAGDMPLSSSSSCTSSAPSTPAPVIGQQQPSPSVQAMRNPKFSFPGRSWICIVLADKLSSYKTDKLSFRSLRSSGHQSG